MQKKTKVLVGAAALLLAGVAGTTAAVAGGDDGDGTVMGPEADRATAAALEITRGGTANAVERDSEDGATWEVEVTRPDGTTVDVRLDEHLRLVVVDGQALPGEVRRARRGEERDDGRDLVRGPRTADRGAPAVLRLLGGLGPCRDPARRDGVASHSPPGHLDGDRAGQSDHPSLGRGVGRLVRHRVDRTRRGGD